MTGYRVSDVMTKQVVYLPAETTLDEAARVMKEADIGDVVVTDGASLAGMLTDRDIVVRAVAENSSPAATTHRLDRHPRGGHDRAALHGGRGGGADAGAGHPAGAGL